MRELLGLGGITVGNFKKGTEKRDRKKARKGDRKRDRRKLMLLNHLLIVNPTKQTLALLNEPSAQWWNRARCPACLRPPPPCFCRRRRRTGRRSPWCASARLPRTPPSIKFIKLSFNQPIHNNNFSNIIHYSSNHHYQLIYQANTMSEDAIRNKILDQLNS